MTIVELAGRARGGGAELVAAADVAFAAIGTAHLGQVEVLLGVVPRSGGTQHLPGRIGHHRALPVAELRSSVDRLARNVAALPEGVVAAVEGVVPPEERATGLVREYEAWAAWSGGRRRSG